MKAEDAELKRLRDNKPKIYNISPVDVPLQSMSDDATAKATLHS